MMQSPNLKFGDIYYPSDREKFKGKLTFYKFQRVIHALGYATQVL